MPNNPSMFINILPCIPPCDTTVTYEQMVEYINSTLSGVTVSGCVSYEEMVSYVDEQCTVSGTTSSGISYEQMVEYVAEHCTVSGTTSSGISYEEMVEYVAEHCTTSGTTGSGISYEEMVEYVSEHCVASGISQDDLDQIYDYIDSIATPAVIGSSVFDVNGTPITHGIGTVNHFTMITPSVSGNDVAAAIGTVYVTLGENIDMVYATGDEEINGLPFQWMVSVSGSLTSRYESLEGTEVTLTFPDTLIESSFFPVVTKTVVSGVIMNLT